MDRKARFALSALFSCLVMACSLGSIGGTSNNKTNNGAVNPFEVSLVYIETKTSEDPGYMEIIAQILIQNTSKQWIYFDHHSPIYTSIETEDGFKYNGEYQTKCSLYCVPEHDWDNEVISCNESYSPRPVLDLLPPGFQTLAEPEKWKISEFAQKPVLIIELDSNIGEFTFEIPLNENSLAVYPTSPFSGNATWQMYKQNYGDVVNIFNLYDSKSFDFGTITFLGFEYLSEDEYFHEIYASTKLTIQNASNGYALHAFSLQSEFYVDASVGTSTFLGNLRTEIDGDSSWSLGPGQSENFLSTINLCNTIDDYSNFQLPAPRSFQEVPRPMCVIIKSVTWGRDDLPKPTKDTDINMVACVE